MIQNCHRLSKIHYRGLQRKSCEGGEGGGEAKLKEEGMGVKSLKGLYLTFAKFNPRLSGSNGLEMLEI